MDISVIQNEPVRKHLIEVHAESAKRCRIEKLMVYTLVHNEVAGEPAVPPYNGDSCQGKVDSPCKAFLTCLVFTVVMLYRTITVERSAAWNGVGNTPSFVN